MTEGVSSIAIQEDGVVINIDKKLEGLSSLSFEHCIYRVPHQLRKVNEKAYEPQVISIGPYHHGKDHLKAMEEHKLRFLQLFLKRSEKNVSDLVERFRTLEESALRCYARPVDLDRDKFVEMMVFDGCFIVELLCMLLFDKATTDPIFQTYQIESRLMKDLLLVENQLPFFVLMEFFSMTNHQSKDRINYILSFFKQLCLPGEGRDREPEYTSEEIMQIKHLLALVHENWQPPLPLIENRETALPKELYIPRCVMELREAGIKFKKKENEVNLFDINFNNGVIEIPKLEILDSTERIMRNFIAYEQLNPSGSLCHVTEYMVFMDSLIDSKKDVELLCREGIFQNGVGDDNAVATLFNKIGHEVFCSRDMYSNVQKRIHDHCMKKRNVQMTKLRHNYFNSPWALISFLAATILLLLTIAQTVFSVMSCTE